MCLQHGCNPSSKTPPRAEGAAVEPRHGRPGTKARDADHEGYVERGGVKIGYEVYGDGDPTILPLPTAAHTVPSTSPSRQNTARTVKAWPQSSLRNRRALSLSAGTPVTSASVVASGAPTRKQQQRLMKPRRGSSRRRCSADPDWISRIRDRHRPTRPWTGTLSDYRARLGTEVRRTRPDPGEPRGRPRRCDRARPHHPASTTGRSPDRGREVPVPTKPSEIIGYRETGRRSTEGDRFSSLASERDGAINNSIAAQPGLG